MTSAAGTVGEYPRLSMPRSPLRIDSLEPLRQRRYGAADVSVYGAAA